jgi:type IV secretion system protein TrbJ
MKKKTLTPFQRGLVVGATTLTLTVVLSRPALAIFGVGDIVFDPSSYGQMLAMVGQMVQEYNQVVKIYSNGVQMYNQALSMAQRFSQPQKSLWMTLGQTAVNDSTRNQFGETATWPTMVNGRPELAPGAWTSATQITSHLGYLSNSVPGSSQPLAQLASVEAQDGSATKCLATIAEYRENAVANRNAVFNLEAAETDGSDDTNSEIEQLNLMNAAQAQANTEVRSQGTVHACLVEQQILAAKVQRDTLADHLSFVGKANDYSTVEQNNWGGVKTSFADYRNP